MNSSVRLASVAPWNEGSPRIHGPDITGASVGKPFFYAIPVTGERPLTFFVEDMPAGLSLDSNTGFITGMVTTEGDYELSISVQNKHGSDEKSFTIAIGRGLALTPPMGWNSWNAWRRWVSAGHVYAAARALVNTGLAARGYTYVNIDSCWQGERGGPFHAIQSNAKFPDMKKLSDDIHHLGLKFGIYSTPWVEPWGCGANEAQADWGGGALIGSSSGEQDMDYPRHPYGGSSAKYVGKEKHEPADVAQFVAWGVDFLKYDWAPTDPVCLERMARPLKAAARDIILSVCTEAKVTWAEAYLQWTEMWRGIPDTEDTWHSVLINGFISDDSSGGEDWRIHVRPGKWNDLDMMALGPQFKNMHETKPNRLSADEQITHMTLWALYPSPLILSCDLSALSDFELRLFANDEVLAINQDRLGACATRVRESRVCGLKDRMMHHTRIHARPLANGDIAVGMYNLGDMEDVITVTMEDLGFSRAFYARNVWERRDLGRQDDQVSLTVPAHGAQMLRLQKA